MFGYARGVIHRVCLTKIMLYYSTEIADNKMKLVSSQVLKVQIYCQSFVLEWIFYFSASNLLERFLLLLNYLLVASGG